MSRRIWIWVRIIGWILLLSGSFTLLITSAFDFFDDRNVRIMNSILSLVGTFCVLYGYYRLEREAL
ncbi:MAG: hypothetical protein JSV76_04870 [Candidatus Bathyarchaeota archaeon]|nr:MAG: hypothetical protein JSV76_04870 [Candidatus Bathyarchaeota archaeon]